MTNPAIARDPSGAGQQGPGSVVATWLLASRPATLAAAVVPVAVGAAVAHASASEASGGVRLWPTLGCLWGAIWIQIGTNFANDVFDFEKGADTGERLGPTRAVQAGWVSPARMRAAMWLAFALAFLAGIYLTWVGGWPLLVIGLLSIASGIAYTGGPYPLGYHGLGDLFVLIFFGFVAVCGTVYVNLGWLPPLAWWASIPPGVLATNILVVNNVRDRETDVVAGKRTLAVRLGRRAGLVQYLLLLATAYGAPLAIYASGKGGAWVLLPLLTLPVGLGLFQRLSRLEGKALNPVLVGTARLLVIFGLLFTAGLVLS
ncbi:MAG: 1,4-dihydroxy-2-naphthoate polyprenyltransferase [Holophagales bacterium]|nr:1,4-dihydroxy-2-naphthoate polyprenyltransferase [Holophagales bacterium]